MRTRGGQILGIVVLVWLIAGVVAAYKLDYFKDAPINCAHASTIAATVLAGPLNWGVVDAKVQKCPEANIPPPHPPQSAGF